MVGEIGVREFGADDVLVFGEREERGGCEDKVVGNGWVVVSVGNLSSAGNYTWLGEGGGGQGKEAGLSLTS